jgi:hypothetical protein
MRKSAPAMLVVIGVCAVFLLYQAAHYAILAIRARIDPSEFGGASMWTGLLMIDLVGIALCCLAPFLPSVSTWFTFHRARVTISPDGFTIKCLLGATPVPWRKVREITEDDRYITFWLRSIQGYLIPKRCFPGDAQIADFRDTAMGYFAQGESPTVVRADSWPPPPVGPS